MGNIRRNISRSEMACRDRCGFDACDTDLMDLLQETVDHFSVLYATEGTVYLAITSPNRCVAHNETVQKAVDKTYVPYSSKSTHMLGIAADFKIRLKQFNGQRRTISPSKVYHYIDQRFPGSLGLGLYSNRCHVDMRETKARW